MKSVAIVHWDAYLCDSPRIVFHEPHVLNGNGFIFLFFVFAF